jgi:hypothetical protein
MRPELPIAHEGKRQTPEDSDNSEAKGRVFLGERR